MKQPSRTMPLFRVRNHPRSARRRYAHRGATFVEFALASVTFLTLLVSCFDWNYGVFVKTALRHAVREGLRQGITANAAASIDHVELVKNAVARNSFGLIDARSTSFVKVNYYGADGVSIAARPEERKFLTVAVERYPASKFGFLSGSTRVSVSASDQMSAGLPQ